MMRFLLTGRVCKLSMLALSLVILVGSETRIEAQLNERVSDPTGFSIRLPRIQIIHSDNEKLPGTSMYLQRKDPWLAYELGHSYFEREWATADGVFASLRSRPLAGAVNSCAMCHNLPFRTAGSGGNVGDPPGFGQNAPHLFGIGLVETIALQVRQQILASFDTNHNGYLDVPAETNGRRAVVEAAPGVNLDFGSLEDLDGDGFPGLNNVIKITFVDMVGTAIPPRSDGTTARLGDPGVSGYDLAIGFLSSTTTDHQMASLRMFTIGVIQTVMGLAITDHTISNDSGTGRDRRAHDGWAETSNSGAPQLYFPLLKGDCVRPCLPLSEGELDLIEWYLLNHPSPAVAVQTKETERGRKLLGDLGCTKCHVADWHIRSADEKGGLTGDRRFFNLEVKPDPAAGGFQGNLQKLTADNPQDDGAPVYLPQRGRYVVKNIFTDMRHHDVGERFYLYRHSAGRVYVNKMFRTPPLWGAGSSAPYGYDGRSPTLDDVIRRHGGDAHVSRKAYSSSPLPDRKAVIAFLKSLVLYQPDELPTDINGDGKIEQNFAIQGRAIGPERFWPEFLFRVAPLYRGWVTQSDGESYFSYSLLNAPEAYGRTLEALIDKDGDRVPDVAADSGFRTHSGARP